MTGHISDARTQISREVPSAYSVHCNAHWINLCLQDLARKLKPVRDAIDLAQKLGKLITFSQNQAGLFVEKKEEFISCSTTIHMLCETRWTVRHGCITAILENYEALQTKEEVNQTTHDDYGRKAGGQLALMEKCSTYFGFCLSKLLFGASEQLSRTLHGKDTTVKESFEAANFYEDNRSEEAY